MNDPETAKVIMQIQAARRWLCLRGRVSWGPSRRGGRLVGALSPMEPSGALIRTVDSGSSCKQRIL